MRTTNGVLSFILRLLSLIIALGTALWVKWCQKMLTHIFYNSLESVLAVIHKKWALWNFCIWMKITMLFREHYRKWWFSGVVARKKKKKFYSFSHFIPSNNLSHSVNFPLNYWSKIQLLLLIYYITKPLKKPTQTTMTSVLLLAKNSFALPYYWDPS